MSGSLLTSNCRGATEKPTCNAASRLDFYLPPLNYRAFCRGKIQRLRDQITAWRRSPLPPHNQLAAEESLWRSAAPTTSPRDTLRPGQMSHASFSNSKQGTWSAGGNVSRARNGFQQASQFCFSNTEGSRTATGKSVDALGRVSAVPYFHDYIFFCLPNVGNASVARGNARGTSAPPPSADSHDADRCVRERSVELCCGVTANKEEMIYHAKHLNISARLSRGGGPVVSDISDAEQNDTGTRETKADTLSLFLSPTPGYTEAEIGAAAMRGSKPDALFWAKAQGVALAMTVHAECTRRQSFRDRQRKSVECQSTFSRTMEVPIDWSEFERLPSNNAASPFSATQREMVSSPAGMESTAFLMTPPVIRDRRGPMRLYTIRMKASERDFALETKAEPAPRKGQRVILPEFWHE